MYSSHIFSLLSRFCPRLCLVCACLASPCDKVCSSGWTGRACTDARVSPIPVSVRWPCWPPPAARRPTSSWRSHTRPSPAADTRRCSALQGRRGRRERMTLGWVQPKWSLLCQTEHFIKVLQNAPVSTTQTRSGNLQFSFQTSTLLFRLTFLHPSLTLSPRLMADIKFCSAAKKAKSSRARNCMAVYMKLWYTLRERGREVRIRKAIEHISSMFLPLYECLSALESPRLTILERCRLWCTL